MALTHINAVLCASVPSAQIGARSSQLYYGRPWLAGKRLVRGMQRMRFHAKITKNDLKATDFLKYNFYFET